MRSPGRTRKAVVGGVLVLAGFGAGAAFAVMGSASADPTPSPGAQGTEGPGGAGGRSFDPSQSVRPDERLLTGTTRTKVTAAVKAAYPAATIERVETDSDGVYEAHIVTAGGEHVIVQVGKDFAITGTQTGGPGGHAGPGGPGGHWGDHDGDGPPAGAPSA